MNDHIQEVKWEWSRINKSRAVLREIQPYTGRNSEEQVQKNKK